MRKAILRPRFGSRQLDEITRDDIKKLISDLLAKGSLTQHNPKHPCVIRGMFNQAIEKWAGRSQSSFPAGQIYA